MLRQMYKEPEPINSLTAYLFCDREIRICDTDGSFPKPEIQAVVLTGGPAAGNPRLSGNCVRILDASWRTWKEIIFFTMISFFHLTFP